MPTYEYQCQKCKHKFEEFQLMTDTPLNECPVCKGPVKKLIGFGSGLIFKGSGFYITDYKQKESGSSLREQRVRWWPTIVFLVLSAVPALLLYGLYFLKSKDTGTRAWVELADLAPVWQSWVTAPPGHWLYGGG